MKGCRDMVHDEYIEVLVKLMKISATLTESFSIVNEQCGELKFRNSDGGTFFTCEVFTNQMWETLFFLSTKTDITYDYMTRNPDKYREIVLYRSDIDEYWTFNGESNFYTSDYAKESSFHFNLSINDSLKLSNHIKALQCFRESTEARKLLNSSGYHLLMYYFSDNITQNLIKILEEGVLKI